MVKVERRDEKVTKVTDQLLAIDRVSRRAKPNVGLSASFLILLQSQQARLQSRRFSNQKKKNL